MVTTTNTRTRIAALLSVMIAFAVMMSAAPASAARSTAVGTPGSAASQDMGKFSLFVYDADSATKRPITKASVVASNENIILDGWTDESGRFSGMLKEGTYQVNVSANNYKNTTLKLMVKIGGTTHLDAAMDKEVALGKFSLFVYDADSATKRPIAKASVVVSNGNIVLKGWTDANGRISGMLKEGTYEVNVSAYNFKNTTLKLMVKSGETTNLDAAMGKEVVLGKLAVYAWDASGPTIAPLVGATVLIYDSKGVQVAKGLTDKYGLYTVGISPDLHTVLILADGYVPTKAEALVKAGEATILNVKVQK